MALLAPTSSSRQQANDDASTSTGALTPVSGSGTASLVGGVSATFASGSPSDTDTTDNSGWNVTTFPAQGTGSGTAGVQFAVRPSAGSSASETLAPGRILLCSLKSGGQ